MAKRIAVMGVGAMGGTIGAYLTREGLDVTLIDQWADHVNLMKSQGLKLTNLKETFTVPVKALHLSEVSNIRDPFDIIFLSVKSYDTRWSTHLIMPILKPTGFILPAQNALNDERVASVAGYHRTVGCVVTVGGGIYEPAHVTRTDPLTNHSFTIGELSGVLSPRVNEIVELLKVIGPSKSTTNIWGFRWAKLTINCMGNVLPGLMGTSLASLNEEQQGIARRIMITIGCEAVRVAMARGISVEPIWKIPAQEFYDAGSKADIQNLADKLKANTAILRISPEQIEQLGGVSPRPSLLQDVMKGRRTETEYLTGYVAKTGAEVGVETTMNQAITEVMRQQEAGEIEPSPSNLDRLEIHL
jgi:2-dehydropantoate 2-reductase